MASSLMSILPNIYIVKLCFIASLLLDLLGYFAAGEDLVALESSIYRPEAHSSTLYLLSRPSIMSI